VVSHAYAQAETKTRSGRSSASSSNGSWDDTEGGEDFYRWSLLFAASWSQFDCISARQHWCLSVSGLLHPSICSLLGVSPDASRSTIKRAYLVGDLPFRHSAMPDAP
jgi:hypothetical protein